MIMGIITKSQPISKRQVWEAYLQIRNNGKSAGIDKVDLDKFKSQLSGNLYKLWNRMSSGSYFPQPVKEVEIPKKDGTKRSLGIPTVLDRVAQMVVKQHLEPVLELEFHRNSFGYRPGKSAHNALDKTREMCWKYAWVIDLDIKGFFDNLDHELLMRAVKKHCKEKWVLMYIERWLKSPLMKTNGALQQRDKGTPQGGVISPLLANLFLHYAFDKWMERMFPEIEFERYADDIIIHCNNHYKAEVILCEIRKRLNECKLDLHPDKTKIVYCKQSNRKSDFKNVSFNFLGFSFQPRLVRLKNGKFNVGFTPAISKEAKRRILKELRAMKIHRWTNDDIYDVARKINGKLYGWINYYGRYNWYALNDCMKCLNQRLIKWITNKYKRFRTSKKKAINQIRMFYKYNSFLFAHWRFGFKP